MGQHLRDVDRSAGKKIFQAAAFLRCFRMERKSGPAKIEVKFAF
jgi:hypothetical protein